MVQVSAKYVVLVYRCAICIFPYRIIIKKDTLVIQNVGPEDEGVYTCEGTTLLDSATDDSRVIVLGK